MKYYPALLDLRNRLCCVIGGGSVAGRKVRSLLSAGARVEVIAPRLSKYLSSLAKKGLITCRKSAYNPRHIRAAFLVVAATADPAVNRCVSADAARLRLLANIVDRPELSNFIVPAVLNKGDLIIAVSTSGTAPALSKRIKEDLRSTVLDTYTRALTRVSRERARLKQGAVCFGARKRALASLARRELRKR